ncbi:hypothetical protein L249_4529 [Ophiocordyceps polyrhachis-furcata BCC 54312]|uniref:FAD-binding domain-containing protein n=1 Tax=Ophiocordyceps polyrhachis-furcata BCC 54312 TaxID=1330021 RepID=A0A367KZ54_9HYPO|nr:hypothetical protein L249_4529 [Ophiocordyceps polyrhachis-furcata BCC 54312]
MALLQMPKDDFKVLIVGGSIAGLTLAHCLEKLNISYEILEQGRDISPQVGASVGILPNGARVLDQLGIFDQVEEAIEPLTFARIRFPDGGCLTSQYPTVLRSRFGYPLSFLERQKLLEILYSRLDGKHLVHTSQRVVRIEDDGHRAIVHTVDGKEYTGDLVVGADGVHSIVRSEIWRHDVKGIVTDKEKSSLIIDYACVFGISTGVKGVAPGLQLSLLDHGLTIHVFNGKDGKAFWFVVIKTKRRYAYHERPLYTPEDGRKTCEGIASKRIDGHLTFGHLWERCQVSTMTPLEEGCFDTWYGGRMVCVGDAVRKVTPNIGQGANMAIEDVAAVANALWSQRDKTRRRLEMGSIVQAIRLNRTRGVCRQSEFLTRMQAHDGLLKSLLVRYALPALHDIPAGSSVVVLGGAQRLAFAPLPARASTQASTWTVARTLVDAFKPRPGVVMLLCVLGLVVRAGLVSYK